MELSKTSEVDVIEIVKGGFVQIRTATTVLEGDTVLSRTLHRRTILPDDDVSDETDLVKAACSLARIYMV